ncbi:MAG TPA: sigma factor, partial [Actinomycetota bacterium]|nr:sigma factor [Actinomycetota bacterium]
RRSAAFGEAWAELEPELRRSLASAPANVVDDVLQETSIKLLRVWDSIDHDRPALPLAVTIARNALRDELRRSARHSHAELWEEARVRDDLDTVVSARLELARVGSELTRLTPGQRAALLAEVGGGPRPADTPRIKMLRSRARARLRELVAQAGAFVTTGVARLRTSAGRAFSGLPDVGILAQAVLLAVVATGSAETMQERDLLDPGRRVVVAVGETGRREAAAPVAGSSERAGGGVTPTAQGTGVPLEPRVVRSDGDGPSQPGLPTPPIPRSHGNATDGGYFGTEGWTQAGGAETSAAGHDAGYRYETEWESPGCVQRLAEGEAPGRCDAPEEPSAAAEVEVDGRRHRVDTDDRPR